METTGQEILFEEEVVQGKKGGGKKGVSQIIWELTRKFERLHFAWLSNIGTHTEDEITAARKSTGKRSVKMG